MNIEEQTKTESVILTQPAAEAVQQLLAKRNLTGYALRVFVQGGGCSGYQYGMALDSTIRESDVVAETNGIKVIVDEVSIKYVNGATVDYVDDLMGNGFKISNPNAVSSCGCGQSFNNSENDGSSAGGCSGCGN